MHKSKPAIHLSGCQKCTLKVYIMYPFWNLVRMDDTRSKNRLEKCTQKQKHSVSEITEGKSVQIMCQDARPLFCKHSKTGVPT